MFDSRAGKTLGDTQHAGTVPDHLFLLQLPDGSQRGFAVEIDRGTMPVTHRGFTGSSIEKKMRVYLAAQKSRVDAERWGMSNFRVLFITPHPKRSASIRALCKSLGTDVAWTAEQGSLTAKTMLAALWQDLHGKAHGLVPPIFMK